MREDVATFECARDDACVGDAVAVRRIHAGLHLEHERAERVVGRAARAVDVERAVGRGCEFGEHVEQLVDAEVQRRGGEQHR